MREVIDVDTETSYRCDNCGAVVGTQDVIEGTLYECGNCGSVWHSESGHQPVHKCDECHKFGAKVGEGLICPECEEALLEDEETGYSYACPFCNEEHRCTPS